MRHCEIAKNIEIFMEREAKRHLHGMLNKNRIRGYTVPNARERLLFKAAWNGFFRSPARICTNPQNYSTFPGKHVNGKSYRFGP